MVVVPDVHVAEPVRLQETARSATHTGVGETGFHGAAQVARVGKSRSRITKCTLSLGRRECHAQSLAAIGAAPSAAEVDDDAAHVAFSGRAVEGAGNGLADSAG